MKTQTKNKLKTVDINAKEWFDKVNGNSYFAGTVTINYGMDSERIFKMPFQYGYGSQYEWEALRLLKNEGVLSSDISGLYDVREKLDVIVRQNIQTNCLKRELKSI